MRNVFIWVLLLAIVTGCGKSSSGGIKEGENPADSLVALVEQGDAEAQYELGRRYYKGDGIKRDYGKAFEWWKKAAEQGHAKAQCSLGVCYENGDGVERDYVKAVEWFTKAAEQGNAEAQNELGKIYYYGDIDEEDYEKAVEWFTMAAEQGLAEAQCFLGFCYCYGEGVKKDFEKGIEWFTKAAEQGWAEAQYLLGEYYNYGEGVEQDLEKAAEWYAKAAEHDRFARDALEFLEEYRNSGNTGSQFRNSKKVSKLTGYINGHKYVDLGLSVKWAACNVGASSPEEYGDRFAWGETSTKNEYTEENSKTPPVSVGCIAGNPLYDAARANWGGTWRLPTGREIGELNLLCKWIYVWEGVEGYKVTGPNGNSIFFPSYKEDNGFGGYCCYGKYWSANHQLSDYSEHLAYTFFFARAYSRPVFDTIWTSPYYGFAVRPVSE